MKSKQYVIQYNTVRPGDNENAMYEIARVYDVNQDKLIASIVYSKQMYQAMHYHFAVFRSGVFCEYEIRMSDLYYGLIETALPVFEAMVMHEIGHIVDGVFETDNNENDVISKRLQSVMKGKVMPEELSADTFAVEHCGKNAVIRMLDNSISMRKRRNTIDGEIAIRELELRKRAVSKL